MKSAVASRRYGGLADLPPLLAFASRAFKERAPLNACWHPGDVVWELLGVWDQPQPIRMWEGPEGVAAVGWFVGPGRAWLETLPSTEYMVPEIVAWAEQAARRRPVDGEAASLSIRAFERDRGRIAALERLGYVRSSPDAVCFLMDLAAPRAVAEAPAGFRVCDCVGVDAERRARAHRDAWDHLAHIGLPEARSTFSAARYEALRAAPVYDPTLDMLVEAPTGAYAAGCVAWADAASGVGVFEPVGTSVAFRGRRLAAVAMSEALRRLADRGLAFARVGTAHFNTSAIGAYLAAGFTLDDRASWWTRALV